MGGGQPNQGVNLNTSNVEEESKIDKIPTIGSSNANQNQVDTIPTLGSNNANPPRRLGQPPSN